MTEKEIVKLWQDNRKELRALQYYLEQNKEAVKRAESNSSDMSRYNGCDREICTFGAKSCIYSLRQDFKLPEPEKWWYCNESNTLIDHADYLCEPESITKSWVEVPPADLPYVRAQIERHKKGEIDLSEWAYWKPKFGVSSVFVRRAEAKVSSKVSIPADYLKVVEPVMKYLAENHHPHVTIIITSGRAECVEGIYSQVTDKFIQD